MIVGRGCDIALIEERVAAARSGHGSALIVSGDPGVGKTSLLDAVEARCTDVSVIRIQAFEREHEIPFVSLRELLIPMLDRSDELPAPQRYAVLGALGIDAAVFVEPLSLHVGTLGLLSLASQERPLLVLLDDLQWVDAASLDAILFAARRLRTERVAMVLASREEGLDVAAAGVPQHRLAGLDAAAAAALIRGAGALPLAEHVVEGLVRATGGNPLGMLELLGQGEDAVLAVTATPLQPTAVGELVRRSFGHRLRALSGTARTAVLVGALAGTPDMDVVAAAAERLGAAADDVLEAEDAGVIEVVDGRLRFRHPLLRAVAAGEAPPSARRRAHTALAAVTADRPEVCTWHTAAAAVAPDEPLARALEDVAADYERRSGLLAAAKALELAARLSPDRPERARRIVRSARLFWGSGSARHALALLDEALTLEPDDARSLEARFLRTVISAWGRSTPTALDAYTKLAASAEAVNPQRAISAYAFAAAQALVTGNTRAAKGCVARIEALRARTPLTAAVEAAINQTQGTVELFCGDSRIGQRLLRRAAHWHLGQDAATESEFIATRLLWMDDYETAERLIEPRLAQARVRGDVRTLARVLEVLADLRHRTGDWTAALAAAAESARLASSAVQPAQRGFSLATLALVQAGMGDEAARASGAEVRRLAAEHGLSVLEQYAGAALGQLELGLGNLPAAISELEAARRWAVAANQREPGVLPWQPDLVEAYARSGNQDAACAVLDDYARHAQAAERRSALAAVQRCRALLSSPSDRLEAFAAALAAHEQVRAPFEAGRTHLGFGQQLRRQRQRVRARQHLSTALEIFERLGARSWAEVTRRELRASGETLRPRDVSLTDALTPQELQIALLVARGASNKDVAGEMFLSPKTVETHLTRIYRKLDLRSRTELAYRLQATPNQVFTAS